MRRVRAGRACATMALALATTGLLAGCARQPEATGWPVYGADQGASKFSALADIDRSNVSRLAVAWQWSPGETPLEQYGTTPGAFQATPLMLDGVLYVSTPYNQVAALDADTGAERWRYDPKAYEDGQPASGQGFIHRGVAAFREDDGTLRIFMNSRHRLIKLDAATGAPVEGFGEHGVVDLSRGLVWEVNRKHYASTSPPVVYKDLVIVGNGVGDRLTYRNDPPGDVRAYDAQTGALRWTFHTIPQPGEFGHETWGNDSWKFVGHTNVWAPMSLDEERGLLYMPVSTPSNDYYGGRRPGANLFAESIVCLDAATGERKWHFQITHHGLWDLDPPAAPVLVTLKKDGRDVDAVVQLTKQGFAFVFDRVTGEPVWPIEERPVPQSDIPGEQSWPTQPFPTNPPAFMKQGVTLDDAFDVTPELEAEARSELAKYRLGPLYTPPSAKGTVARPSVVGGADWGGGAWDASTGVMYVKANESTSIFRIVPFDPSLQAPGREGEVDADYVQRGAPPVFHNGLPLLKPPYAHLVAIDLNAPSIKWRVPFGDQARLREHPALAGVDLPARLGSPGNSGAIATAGGLVFIGSGDTALYAFDTDTGEELARVALPQPVQSTPMTYRTTSGRQFIVVGVGRSADAALVALALPQ
ncbi:MAG: pyrroloquinoline quinone-dependent dehydrogenase [Vicinamibacterales bacterium]